MTATTSDRAIAQVIPSSSSAQVISDDATIARKYIDRFEREYMRPAFDMFMQAFDTHPLTAAFAAAFCALSFLPVTAFLSVSVFVFVLLTLVTLSIGFLAIIVAQLALVLALVLVLASILVLSAIITALGSSLYLGFQLAKTSRVAFDNLQLPHLDSWATLPVRTTNYISENAPAWADAAAAQFDNIPQHLCTLWGWVCASLAMAKQVPWRQYSAPICAILSKVMTVTHFAMTAVQIILAVVGLKITALRIIYIFLRFTMLLLWKSASVIYVQAKHWLATPLESERPTRSQSPIEMGILMAEGRDDVQGASTAVSVGMGEANGRVIPRSHATEA